ncbi:MATE family efflux transporter [uncultured Methanomethylovorans sp.]|uniref:MATE family efflux transporter n=1 Tax=uncultured Methanomethylovorans sp. TaxID=183759 RepID=UPI0026236711|nr:MATE family efflux transporter [uncultured Methanomethylovorans sp.]
MVSEEELRSKSIWKLFQRFVFPAIMGIIVAGVQTIIDGYFIGNGVGSQGLAGVTLAFPAVMCIVAVAVMMGMGSSSLVALELGRSNRYKAGKIVANIFPLVFVVAAVITIAGLAFGDPLLSLFDAPAVVQDMAGDYLRVVLIGSVFFLLTITLDPLVRNDGYPMIAMNIMVVSVLTNLVLDYIFVMRMDMGVTGAAIATVIAFAVSAVRLMLHFFSSKAGLRVSFRNLRFEPQTVHRIMEAGLPSFAMQLSVSILFFAHNFVLLQYGSDADVSAYGIMGYSFSIFYMLFEGIAVGVQPIIGFNYGAGLYDRVCRTLKLAMTACVAVGALGFLVFFLFPEKVVQFFTPDDPLLLEVTVGGMRIFVLSLIVQGVVVVNATYFQSINRVRSALFIHLGKIFIFLLPLLFTLPMVFGLKGVWLATPAADYLMFFIVMVMLAEELKELQGENKSCSYK